MSEVSKPGDVKQAVKKRWPRGLFAALCWGYLAIVLGLWIFVRSRGDRAWFATLLLFGPRWVLATPLLLLIPAACFVHRRSLWVLGIVSVIALGPVMGLCLPWGKMTARGSGPTVRVLTCNIHRYALNVPELSRLIADAHPDVVALQEWSPKYQAALFGGGGWHVVSSGELCLATRWPIRHARAFRDWDGMSCEIVAPGGVIRFYNVHLASPHYALRDAIQGTDQGAEELERNISERLKEAQDLADRAGAANVPVVIAGDFNLPADSSIYRENLSMFSDSFSEAGFGYGLTYHSTWTAVRIDHILTNSNWVCRQCWVGPNVNSPHRPVLADLQLRAGQ